MLKPYRFFKYMTSTLSTTLILTACTSLSSNPPAAFPHTETVQEPASATKTIVPDSSPKKSSPLLTEEYAPRFPQWPLPVSQPNKDVSLTPKQSELPRDKVQQPTTPVLKKPSKPLDKGSQTASSQQNNNKKHLSLGQLVKKYPDLLLLRGSINSNKVALTFDDAPDTKYTPAILDILKKYNVKATFFVVGQSVEKYPSVVKRMIKEGHVVGNHTYNHSLLTKLSNEQFQTQVNKTQKLLKSTIGYTPKLFRPPYGEISESQLLWASTHHMVVVNWNVDSLDWKQLSQTQVSANILNHAKAGSIILQHAGGGPNQDLSGTVSALPGIIEALQSRGYQLVTLPELLKVSKQL
jgi:peptidoglycan/xylan/chitin deacetylase (PgdA/CDA1 family)